LRHFWCKSSPIRHSQDGGPRKDFRSPKTVVTVATLHGCGNIYFRLASASGCSGKLNKKTYVQLSSIAVFQELQVAQLWQRPRDGGWVTLKQFEVERLRLVPIICGPLDRGVAMLQLCRWEFWHKDTL